MSQANQLWLSRHDIYVKRKQMSFNKNKKLIKRHLNQKFDVPTYLLRYVSTYVLICWADAKI